MKKIFVTLLLILFCCPVALTQPIIRINLDPSNGINIGSVTVCSSKLRGVIIRNDGNEPLIISSFSIEGDCFSLPNNEDTKTVTINPIEIYNLMIQFAPTNTISYPGSITLTHNASNSPTTIHFYGGYGIHNRLDLSPMSIDFGDVNLGSSLQRSIRLQNSGTGPVTVSSVSINGTGFTLPNNEDKMNWQINYIYDLSVKFSPTAFGSHTGSITLTHDGSNSPLKYTS